LSIINLTLFLIILIKLKKPSLKKKAQLPQLKQKPKIAI